MYYGSPGTAGSSHCETDGKTVRLREAPRSLRGAFLWKGSEQEPFYQNSDTAGSSSAVRTPAGIRRGVANQPVLAGTSSILSQTGLIVLTLLNSEDKMGLRSDAAANRDLITPWAADVNPIKSTSSKCATSCKQGVWAISSGVL